MHLPAALVADAFTPPADGGLDFDAVAAPRALRPRPVGAVAAAEAQFRSDLAWFWNSNADWAEDQIAIGDGYEPLVRRLIRSLGLGDGDRVVLPLSEPDARRAAWREALPAGAEAVDWPPGPLGHLALEDLGALLDERTRVVVVTKACPVTGALNEMIPAAQFLAGRGAALVTEASHFVPHGSLDIRNLRCDALIASGDELFGARGAALWLRHSGPADLSEENGGVSADTLEKMARAVAYAERLGGAPGAPVAPPSDRFGRREPMRSGMQRIRHEERVLSRVMLRGLAGIPRLSVLGEADPRRAALRLPTFTFTVEGESPQALASALGAEGVRVGSGDLGCAALLASRGMDPEAGAIRASLAHYHRREDVERFLRILGGVLGS